MSTTRWAWASCRRALTPGAVACASVANAGAAIVDSSMGTGLDRTAKAALLEYLETK